MKLQGAWLHSPFKHIDERGSFQESFKFSDVGQVLGREFIVRQTNISISKAGVIRGIHWADVPPGQAKFISCSSGVILDIVVDLRTDSGTFGQWDAEILSPENGNSILIDSGFGHGFLSLKDDSVVTYLCDAEYSPSSERVVNPFDKSLNISYEDYYFPASGFSVSSKDLLAPTLKELLELGLLPTANLLGRKCG